MVVNHRKPVRFARPFGDIFAYRDAGAIGNLRQTEDRKHWRVPIASACRSPSYAPDDLVARLTLTKAAENHRRQFGNRERWSFGGVVNTGLQKNLKALSKMIPAASGVQLAN